MAPIGVLRKCTFRYCDRGALSRATPSPTMRTATAAILTMLTATVALAVRTALPAAITGQNAAEQACAKGSGN